MDLGIVGPEEIRMRPEATVEEILRVPERAYVHRFLTGSLSSAEIRKIGFPCSGTPIKRPKRSCGALGKGTRQRESDLTRWILVLNL